MHSKAESERHIGLCGATGVGVGAIVGGGILALAGAAFAAAGPAAIVAFALNGLIALLTAPQLLQRSPPSFPDPVERTCSRNACCRSKRRLAWGGSCGSLRLWRPCCTPWGSASLPPWR